MNTYTITLRGRGKTRNAVVIKKGLKKGGMPVAQFCAAFLKQLWLLPAGQKTVTVTVSNQSINPAEEWKITVHPWHGGAETITIHECTEPGPHKVWPSIALLLRDAAGTNDDQTPADLYVMATQTK